MINNLLKTSLDKALSTIEKSRQLYSAGLKPVESGVITTVLNGIAKISGLPGVEFDELVKLPEDVYGIAFNIDPDEIGVVLLGDYSKLQAGDKAERTGRVMDVPVGDALIGRVLDPLGRPLDGRGPLNCSERLPLERMAPHIMDRAPVTEPLQTGIMVIDALIPVGMGQRELILGDRQTGKSAVAISTILNQRGKHVLCVYCAIGQRASAVAKVVAELREKGAMEYTIVLVTEGNDPSGLQYISAFAATSIAEYFMERGDDVLIVYDDLTNHARAYRELSLLLKRPPGREAFPGDIFYLHSRLLERSTHLRDELGGGSLTALPIIETQEQNISAYIPTNLISITDGQIYLSPTLFELGILPAVDIAQSVSRVGGKAQLRAYSSVTSSLKLDYVQFEELESFSRFGTRLDEASRKIINHGERIRECFKQDELFLFSAPEQLMVLLALAEGYFDTIALEKVHPAMVKVGNASLDLADADLVQRIVENKELSAADHDAMLQAADSAMKQFRDKQ